MSGAPDTWHAVPWQQRMVFLACGLQAELRVEGGHAQGLAERLAGRLGHSGHHVLGQIAEDRLRSLQKGDQSPPFPFVVLQQIAELFFQRLVAHITTRGSDGQPCLVAPGFPPYSPDIVAWRPVQDTAIRASLPASNAWPRRQAFARLKRTAHEGRRVDLKPKLFARTRRYSANVRGSTYSTTGRWREEGRRYCPMVTTSHPDPAGASRSTAFTSSGVSAQAHHQACLDDAVALLRPPAGARPATARRPPGDSPAGRAEARSPDCG